MHWSLRKIFCEARRVTHVWCTSEQITHARNYACELYCKRFVCTNTHSHARSISRARKFVHELFHAIATCTRIITMQVNLRWRPASAAYSSPMAVSTIDCHVYNHMTLNNVHCLEWSHFYCCMCLTMWKINLPTSPRVLLCNPNKILLNGSKALQAAQKRA